ncbi:hypothetical protein CX680_31350, partial [Klebsiella pneumoniae]
ILRETVAAMARVCLGAEKIPSLNVSKHRLDVQLDRCRSVSFGKPWPRWRACVWARKKSLASTSPNTVWTSS